MQFWRFDWLSYHGICGWYEPNGMLLIINQFLGSFFGSRLRLHKFALFWIQTVADVAFLR